jgi:hypothetical protein
MRRLPIALLLASLALLPPAVATARGHRDRAGRPVADALPAEERGAARIHALGEARVQALLQATQRWRDPALLRARDRRIAEIRRETSAREMRTRVEWTRRNERAGTAAARELPARPRGDRTGA